MQKIWQALEKYYSEMFEDVRHIRDYISVGQIFPRKIRQYRIDHNQDVTEIGGIADINGSDQPYLPIILANTRVVPVTKEFRQIRPNIWVGEASINTNTKMASLGTLYSTTYPDVDVPVFSISYLTRVPDSELNYSVYSDKLYGSFVLNDTALNIDKLNMRMINSTGDIVMSDMPNMPNRSDPPMTPGRLFDDSSTSIRSYNRKVYFTAQGSIAADDDCVKPISNMMKNHLMECNAVGTGMPSAVNDSHDTNASVSNTADDNRTEHMTDTKDDRAFGRVMGEKEKRIVLREKDEPWFTDPFVVGDVAEYDDPHTVTGHNETLEMTDSELYETIERLKPKGSIGTMTGDADTIVLIGTFDGGTDEINMPYNQDIVDRDCDPSTIIGYSRYDKLRKCLGNRAGLKRSASSDSPKSMENFDQSNADNDYNNYIMMAICIIIIVLMMYRVKH